MDSTTLILQALTAGAVASAKDTAVKTVKDAYDGFKALVKSKLAGKPTAELVLAEFEDDPETYDMPLKKILGQRLVDKDERIVEEAQRLLTLIQSQQAALSKHSIQITGTVQGYNQGNYSNVAMNFWNEPEEK